MFVCVFLKKNLKIQCTKGINKQYNKEIQCTKGINKQYNKGVSMIRVDFGPISETVYIDIILNTIIQR